MANAGLDEGLGRLLDVTEAEDDRIYNVNAKGAFFTLQKAAGMVNSGGSIVYIGSSTTLRPTGSFGLYGSSKLPASFLVGVLAQEIGERGITVNPVAQPRLTAQVTSPRATPTTHSRGTSRKGWMLIKPTHLLDLLEPRCGDGRTPGSECPGTAMCRGYPTDAWS